MTRLPLANYRAAGDPVLFGAGADLDAGVFLAQADRLARALPAGESVINLCETRHGFLLGFAAALLRGQVSLLPAARGEGDRQALLRRHPGACLLGERSPGGFSIAGFLADRTPGPFVVPAIESGARAATLFTSGSTGEPTAHHKSWGQLCRGAALLAAALDWPARPAVAIVGSVPPQHMFGLESTVMLPWHAGVPVHARQPLLAADLEAAFAEGDRPAWWMTTPVLLRAPLQAGATLARLQGIVASTASLPPALAQAAEDAWGAPAIEVYGSTETGALATRRTAAQAEWTPLPGVKLRVNRQDAMPGFRAEGAHIDPAVDLGDSIELLPDGRFRWLGRAGDMVKVGGKRASLSALTLVLAGLPGVDDGVFALPPEAAGNDGAPRRAPRLAAFYVSATLEPAELLAALRACLDPAFLPRPLRRVERLPRDANGKLTQAAMAGLAAACRPSQAIAPGHPALPGHFPGDPLVPGVLLLARVAESLRASFPACVPGELLQARLHAPLRPAEPFVVTAWRKDGLARFEVRRATQGDGREGVIASGEWALEGTGPGGARP